MDKYFLFDDKICNNGVAMGNRSVVDSLNHLFKENQYLQKSISEQHNKIANLEAKLAEERNKVCEKIRKKFPMPKDDIPDETTYSLNEFLDQIERGTYD